MSRGDVTRSLLGANGFVVWAETIKQAPAERTQPAEFRRWILECHEVGISQIELDRESTWSDGINQGE